MPHPTLPVPTTANNFLYSPQRIDNGNAFDVKVDHQFTDKDSAFVRYSHAYDDIFQPGLLPAPRRGRHRRGPRNSPRIKR